MSGEERAASASQQRMKMEAQKEEANQKFLSQFTVLRLDGSEEVRFPPASPTTGCVFMPNTKPTSTV